MRVCIIGGGPAGMMAAITAAGNGHRVTILEHNSRIGKKILSTGAGKCNLSNVDMDLSHFHGGDICIIENVLSTFDKDDTIRFFTELGLYTRNRNGYLYPFNEQASSVLDILRASLRKHQVNIITDCFIKTIKADSKGNNFKISASINGEGNVIQKNFEFEKLIIATGSKAAPKTGSDGSGYELAKVFGHTLIKPLPALCGLRCEGGYFKSIKGIRCKARVDLYVNDTLVASEEGEMQINDYGISGIPVMQLSYIAAKSLDEGKKTSASVSFMPEFDYYSLLLFMKKRISSNPEYTCEEMLLSILHKNLSAFLIKKSGISLSSVCKELTDKQIESLCENIISFKIKVASVNSFDESQVCSGGVCLEEVDINLQSKLVPGLYFAGEILDVNGDCGGYNLQWAWSSGYTAGSLIK